MFFISLKYGFRSDFGENGRKESGKLHALKQNSKTKHRPFDSPPRWGFVQVVVVTLEEQEVPSCLSHSPPSIGPSFLAWKSPSISGGNREQQATGPVVSPPCQAPRV